MFRQERLQICSSVLMTTNILFYMLEIIRKAAYSSEVNMKPMTVFVEPRTKPWMIAITAGEKN